MVKKFVFGLLSASILFFSSCDKGEKSAETVDVIGDTAKPAPLKATTISFAEPTHDFGKINQGDKVEHTFVFKNTGEYPLVINDARASCGCTIPEWTKDPVLPGNEGKIKVIYDSAGREGKINKTVSVYANTEPSETVLTINVDVNVEDKSNGPFKN